MPTLWLGLQLPDTRTCRYSQIDEPCSSLLFLVLLPDIRWRFRVSDQQFKAPEGSWYVLWCLLSLFINKSLGELALARVKRVRWMDGTLEAFAALHNNISGHQATISPRAG
jgi:hypothetical protein